MDWIYLCNDCFQFHVDLCMHFNFFCSIYIFISVYAYSGRDKSWICWSGELDILYRFLYMPLLEELCQLECFIPFSNNLLWGRFNVVRKGSSTLYSHVLILYDYREYEKRDYISSSLLDGNKSREQMNICRRQFISSILLPIIELSV